MHRFLPSSYSFSFILVLLAGQVLPNTSHPRALRGESLLRAGVGSEGPQQKAEQSALRARCPSCALAVRLRGGGVKGGEGGVRGKERADRRQADDDDENGGGAAGLVLLLHPFHVCAVSAACSMSDALGSGLAIRRRWRGGIFLRRCPSAVRGYPWCVTPQQRAFVSSGPVDLGSRIRSAPASDCLGATWSCCVFDVHLTALIS